MSSSGVVQDKCQGGLFGRIFQGVADVRFRVGFRRGGQAATAPLPIGPAPVGFSRIDEHLSFLSLRVHVAHACSLITDTDNMAI